MSYKYDHMVALLQARQGAKTVTVQLGGNTYTYKSLIDDLQVNDRVVVQARGDFTVGVVTAIHKTPKINPDAPYRLSWVVSKIDVAWVEDMLTQEEQIKEQIHASEAQERIERMMEQLNVDPTKYDLRLRAPGTTAAALDLQADDASR